MIRISQAFDSNAARCKDGPQTGFSAGAGAGGAAAVGNRPFTMPREWGCKARVKELKRRPAPRPGRHLSVRLSGL
jgi:hypothetical protein